MSKVIFVLLVLAVVASASKKKDKDKERRPHSDYDAERVKDVACDHEGLFEEEKGINKDFVSCTTSQD